MYRSKKFSYDYDEYENGDKSIETMGPDILNDKDFPELEEIIIGDWGDSWDDSPQTFLNFIVENADRFSHIKSLFIGDMESEDCEVSWIIQGNYEKIFHALPNLKELTIKGSTDLELGSISHEHLETLTIICGGLPSNVIKSIETAHLPNLKKLCLYLGEKNYGFDGSIDNIISLLENSDFPKLEYLGLMDSEIQDDITEAVLKSKYISIIKTLDLSCGTLTDKGGQLLLENLPSLPNIESVNVCFHFMSDEMMKKLDGLGLAIAMDDQQEADEYNGELWLFPMLTE